MGNNHDQYFGNQKRKVLVLGIQHSGKTTLVNCIAKDQIIFEKIQTKHLNIEDVKFGNLLISFFDLAGGERQRIFWKQHFEGTQGVIFAVNVMATQEDQKTSLQEAEKLIKVMHNEIPFAICLTHIDQMMMIQWGKYKREIISHFEKTANKRVKVFEIDYKNKESLKNMLSWLATQTQPI